MFSEQFVRVNTRWIVGEQRRAVGQGPIAKGVDPTVSAISPGRRGDEGRPEPSWLSLVEHVRRTQVL